MGPASLAAGALALSWMPPGLLGGLHPRQCGGTLAASATLAAAFAVLAQAAPGLDAAWPGALWLALLLAAALRLATLPGAFVPQAERSATPLRGAERGVAAAALMALAARAWLAARAGTPLDAERAAGLWSALSLALGAALWLDVAARAGSASGRARSAARVALATLAWIAPAPVMTGPAAARLLLAVGAAATFALWRARADRRAHVLSAVFAAAWVVDVLGHALREAAWPAASEWAALGLAALLLLGVLSAARRGAGAPFAVGAPPR